MRSSVLALAALSLGSHVFAAPPSGSISAKRDDFVTSMESYFTQMNITVAGNVSALNSNAAENNGKPSFSAAFTTLEGIGSSLTETVNGVASLLEDPVVDLAITDIEYLVNVLEIWKDVLSEVEGVVDAVVNTFFPGLTDLFKPFIQVWINVVDDFTDPFLDYWSNLVGTLTDSPELTTEINDYIAEIQAIINNFLLAF